MSDLESKIEAALERALVHPCADDFSALHALLPDALKELRARAERIASLEDTFTMARRAAKRREIERDAALARVAELEQALTDLLDWPGDFATFTTARRVLDSEGWQRPIRSLRVRCDELIGVLRTIGGYAERKEYEVPGNPMDAWCLRDPILIAVRVVLDSEE